MSAKNNKKQWRSIAQFSLSVTMMVIGAILFILMAIYSGDVPVDSTGDLQEQNAKVMEAAAEGTASTTLEEVWGIEITSIRLAMADSMLDVRYKLVDSEKAARLGDGKTSAYLWRETGSLKLAMPNPSKEAGFPPTTQKQTPGKNYFIMVPNSNGLCQRGDKVSVFIGDARTTHLTLE